MLTPTQLKYKYNKNTVSNNARRNMTHKSERKEDAKNVQGKKKNSLFVSFFATATAPSELFPPCSQQRRLTRFHRKKK
jgi:hypothetical protein